MFERAFELIKKYTICPECGNKFIGNGEGAIIIEDDSFERSCKCGWKVKIEVKERGEG